MLVNAGVEGWQILYCNENWCTTTGALPAPTPPAAAPGCTCSSGGRIACSRLRSWARPPRLPARSPCNGACVAWRTDGRLLALKARHSGRWGGNSLPREELACRLRLAGALSKAVPFSARRLQRACLPEQQLLGPVPPARQRRPRRQKGGAAGGRRPRELQHHCGG